MKTIVVLGATSAIATAYMRAKSTVESPRLVLVGRRAERLKEIREDMIVRGADASSICIAGELGNSSDVPDLHKDIIEKVGSVDEVVLAYGVLGEQADMQEDLNLVRSIFDVNLVSAAMWCEAFANGFSARSAGHLIIIGSVAGDRGRQSNYIYGATKGGLERLAEGMAHRFAAERHIHITLIKPGFVDTPMTDHIPNKSGVLWATPERIASIMVNAVKKKRVRVYAPWIWRYILLIVRALPLQVMHKTKM